MVKLYRVENLVRGIGLWYNLSQDFANLVTQLDLSNKNVPMPFDEQLQAGAWKSAAESIEQLGFWFKPEDFQRLSLHDFQLSEIEVVEHGLNKTEWYTHPIFQEKQVVFRRKLNWPK